MTGLADDCQRQAAAHEVVISATTAGLVSGRFELVPAAPGPGGDRYRVRSEIRGASRFSSRAAAGLSTFVGREEELELLLRRWALARRGKGQSVLISGEAGIGKSRLIQQLREAIRLEPHRYLVLQCSPYHGSSAFNPVIAALEGALGARRVGDAPACLDALRRHLAEMGLVDEPTLGLLSDLLSLPTAGRLPSLETMDAPAARREATLRALVRYVRERAQRSPMLCSFEDVHWADPSTRELLTSLAETIEHTPLLLLATARPGYQAPWTELAHARFLSLSRLAPEAAERLVRSVAASGAPLPPGVMNAILGRADGNPLFIEELTRAVTEPGASVTSSRVIPISLRDSLMARLDASAAGKAVAQWGAVIGRSFDYRVLSDAWEDSPSRLAEGLNALEGAGLVGRHGEGDLARYTFRHALIRDVAYDSLLRANRVRCHLRVARSLEARSEKLRETQPELLAHHYTAAGETRLALAYWQRAGRRAIRRSAYREAREHAETGLRLLRTEEAGTADPATELALQLVLGVALSMIEGYGNDSTGAAFEWAAALCEAQGGDEERFAAALGNWRFHIIRTHYRRARAFVARMQAVASETGNMGFRELSRYAAGFTALCLGETGEALRHFEPCQRSRRRTGARLPDFAGVTDPRVAARAYSALALWIQGHPDRALTAALDGIRLAEHMDTPTDLALALAYAAITAILRGDTEAAGEHVSRLVAVSEHQGFPFWLGWGTICAGWLRAGDALGCAREDIERGRAILAAAESGNLTTLQAAAHAEALLGAGAPGAALREAAAGLRVADRTGEHLFRPELLRLRGEALVGNGTPGGEAEPAFHLAIEAAASQKAKGWELRAARGLAELWARRGESARATALLEPVLRGFTEGAGTRDLREAGALLQRLS